MGKEIFPGRYTAEQTEDVVVFIIGMRMNKWRAIHKWFPVFKAMPPMIRELYQTKENGFLSMENFFNLRSTAMVQYWRSSEELITYAKGPKHLTAWKKFNQKVRNNDAVGIYHETYVVPKENCESLYGNMPVFGLAKTASHEKITPTTNSARKRMKA